MDLKIIDLGLEKTPEKKKILVVDDEPSLQSLLYDTLSDDYRIVSAHNGREGISLAEHGQPDLILMDLMMPDIGGYEAVRLLNSNPNTQKIPVVVVTSRQFDSTTIQLLKNESNVVAFISKPFKPKALRETIKTALKNKLS